VDGGTNFDVEIQAETTIAAGDQLVVKFSDYYTDVKVQIKAAVADSQTTVEGRAAAVAAQGTRYVRPFLRGAAFPLPFRRRGWNMPAFPRGAPRG